MKTNIIAGKNLVRGYEKELCNILGGYSENIMNGQLGAAGMYDEVLAGRTLRHNYEAGIRISEGIIRLGNDIDALCNVTITNDGEAFITVVSATRQLGTLKF